MKCVIMSTPAASPTIRRATASDFAAVRDFYWQLTDDLEGAPYHPVWKKGEYPNDEYLQASIAAGELWVAEAEGKIAASMVVNDRCNEGYLKAQWAVEAAPGEFTIIHTLGVGMDFQRRGIGYAMTRHAISLAAEAGHKAVRLDLIDQNRPAAPAYTKLGFRKCDTLRLYYESVGWQIFHMYEYAL